LTVRLVVQLVYCEHRHSRITMETYHRCIRHMELVTHSCWHNGAAPHTRDYASSASSASTRSTPASATRWVKRSSTDFDTGSSRSFRLRKLEFVSVIVGVGMLLELWEGTTRSHDSRGWRNSSSSDGSGLEAL